MYNLCVHILFASELLVAMCAGWIEMSWWLCPSMWGSGIYVGFVNGCLVVVGGYDAGRGVLVLLVVLFEHD